MKRIVTVGLVCVLLLSGCAKKEITEIANVEITPQTLNIANPWTTTTNGVIEEVLGVAFGENKTMTDVHYMLCEKEQMAETSFAFDKVNFIARIGKGDLKDISGEYYSWTTQESIFALNAVGKVRTYQDRISAVWYLEEEKISLSLSAQNTDIKTLTKVANIVFPFAK